MNRAELILIAAGFAAILPFAAGPAMLVVAGLAVLWLWIRPGKGESWVVLPALVLLVLGALLPGLLPSLESRLEEGYESIWLALDRQAEEARDLFEEQGVAGRDLAFEGLSSVTKHGDATLFLIDAYGDSLAWAGPGIVHELPMDRALPPSDFVGAFGSVTLFRIEEVGDGPRPWRVVAARSFSTQRLPFLDPREVLDWSLVYDGQGHDASALRVQLPERPDLILRPGESLEQERRNLFVAWIVILAMLGLTALRWVKKRGSAWSAAAWAGLFAAHAAGVSPTGLAVLAIGLAVAASGFVVWKRPGSERGDARLGGLLAGCLLLIAAFASRFLGNVPDLGGEFLLGDLDVLSVRVGFVAFATGLLLAAGRAPSGGSGGKLAVASLLAASFLADRPEWSVPLVLIAGVCAARWLAAERDRRFSRVVLGTLAFAALMAGVSDEIAYRVSLRRVMESRLVAGLARPGAEQLEAVRLDAERYLSEIDLESVAARSPEGLESEDLAFVLWRASPLARRDALTALVVERDREPISSFSFGLPMEGIRLSDDKARWQGLVPPGWEALLTEGEIDLREAGEQSAKVLFWILPRPGFILHAMEEGEELDAGLLKGEPTADSRPEGLPDPYLYGLYDLDGRPILPPWPGAPRLDPVPEGAGGGRLAIPAGSARSRWDRDDQHIHVIFLPAPTPGKALERLGVHALGGLLPLIVLGLVAFVGLLGRRDHRDLVATTFRSYSRRLLLVNALLLIVPLAVLNLVFFRAVEQRIEREQRADGEAALASAQRVLGEYLISLEPGFALETTLNDTLLTWLSRVLQREVSLYWGSREYASSKRELFSVGLLPRRLPGEVYVDLRLTGREISSRPIHAGETSFVVLYARLDVPGVPTPEQRFVVSVPLLAQQEEVARELDSLRRTVILATMTLLLVLGMTGARLASDFTKPILDLVEGTRRIAEGAPSLDLKPSDQELAALVEAIDDMAARIAVARDRLVSEKHLVDRMVDSITSGVVSLDSEGRVLMANRVAIELLGVEPGRPLDAVLENRPGIAPVADFLDQSGADPRQVTLRLVDPEPREWTVIWVPLAGEGDPEALLIVEDVTEVLRVERLEAWAEMARIIAHEIKNPLTPIRLSTELLAEAWVSDRSHLEQVFDRCTGNILKQVEELRLIASEFSDFSQVMKIQPEQGDLGETIAAVVADYLAAPPEGIELELTLSEGDLVGRFDGKLLARTVRNLLENAIRASSDGGKVEIGVARNDELLEVTVGDRGAGVAPELLPKIFEPYFTTHESGTGLGLAIAKRIVEEHGGRIEASLREGGGLSVVLRIPAGL